MNTFTHIKARQIFDSRGNPTIEVAAKYGDYVATASVPSGASTGSYEAHELRDRDETAYGGQGVHHAVSNINDVIGPALLGSRPDTIESIDKVLLNLDGTSNKSRLGANAILAVSMVATRLLAKAAGKPLFQYLRELSPIFAEEKNYHPQLFVNLINGGAHAKGSTTVQEFHILPRTGSLERDLELVATFQHRLKLAITNLKQLPAVGDEGGFVLAHHTTEEALALLHNIKASMHLGGSVVFGMDVAAQSFFHEGRYHIDGQELSPTRYRDMLGDLITKYQIAAIEDPFIEDEYDDFGLLAKTNPNTLVIGDDLTVTNLHRLKIAQNQKSINALIIKPNQIGTISETLDVIRYAKQHHIHPIASHRSGETNDDFIVDLAMGTQCYGMKIGALQRGERIAKYNRLLEITEHENTDNLA